MGPALRPSLPRKTEPHLKGAVEASPNHAGSYPRESLGTLMSSHPPTAKTIGPPFRGLLGALPHSGDRVPRRLGWDRHRPCQRPIPLSGPSPPCRYHPARRRFPFARTALGHDFGTENRASRTLSSTTAKPGHRPFRFFSPHDLNDLRPRPLLVPHLSSILVRGPETEISEG